MTQADFENLDEIKRKALKIVNLTTKIKASGDMVTNHKTKKYLDELDKSVEAISEIRKEIKTEEDEKILE